MLERLEASGADVTYSSRGAARLSELRGEERQRLFGHSFGDAVYVIPLVDLERVCDAIDVEDAVHRPDGRRNRRLPLAAGAGERRPTTHAALTAGDRHPPMATPTPTIHRLPDAAARRPP